ncbi:hypothetical protein [Polynucleobacter brandtiae]|uniref:hypothetical protein n=1 Tax=Polynucleobacter brandtiae TaxID=1938816 RepID=UPI0018E22040|nr:hypothetical protein [Polynucleobacter brandtiae]
MLFSHKTGEAYGTLVLSISVTIIEVALIISLMLTGHERSEFIARDAVFATVMIVINQAIGICIFMVALSIMAFLASASLSQGMMNLIILFVSLFLSLVP